MPKPSLKKIKSALKVPQSWLRLGPLGVLLLAVVAINIYRIGPYFFTNHTPGQTKLLLGSQTYYLEIAATRAAQEKGLSGRTSMPGNYGMLFDFGKDSERCMWMKDMHFPLDMIWADSSKKVTAVDHGVAPDSYPTTYCKTARYVVELNVGAVQNNRGASRIRVGDQLYLQ